MIGSRVSKFYRMIAILLVIASHYAGWMFVEPVHQRAHDIVATFGPYGVDIFFLLSGYGLYKSAEKNGMSWSFVLKRFMGAYLPYVLVIVGLNIWTGGIAELESDGWFNLLTGMDYWYMNVIFIFYIMFIVCWLLPKKVRVAAITLAIVLLSVWYYVIERHDFWMLSNASFLIGIYAAAFEAKYPECIKSIYVKLSIFAVSLVGFIVCVIMQNRLAGYADMASFVFELVSNVFFTLVILALCLLTPNAKYLPTLIGGQSLFIYIFHQTFFWQMTVKFEGMEYAKMAVIIALLTLLIATVMGIIYERLLKLFYKVVKI